MVEVEQNIILHITLFRNLLREFVCTVVSVYFAFHLWIVCVVWWFRNVRNVCSQEEICGVTWRKKMEHGSSLNFLALNKCLSVIHPPRYLSLSSFSWTHTWLLRCTLLSSVKQYVISHFKSQVKRYKCAYNFLLTFMFILSVNYLIDEAVQSHERLVIESRNWTFITSFRGWYVRVSLTPLISDRLKTSCHFVTLFKTDLILHVWKNKCRYLTYGRHTINVHTLFKASREERHSVEGTE